MSPPPRGEWPRWGSKQPLGTLCTHSVCMLRWYNISMGYIFIVRERRSKGGCRREVIWAASQCPVFGLCYICMWSVCGLGCLCVVWVWSGLPGFHWGVLGFTGCGLGFTGPHWTLLGVDWVSLDFTGPPWTPLDPPWPHWNLLEFTGIYWPLTGIYWNLLELLTQHWPPWLVSTAFQPLGFMTSPPPPAFQPLGFMTSPPVSPMTSPRFRRF